MMTLTIPFTQRTAIDTYEANSNTKLPTRGLCFRVAFKWAACHATGAEFKYLKLNAQKTAGKHLNYRQASLKLEQDTSFDFSDDTNIKNYVNGDQVQAQTYLAQWGKSFTDANKKEHSVATGQPFEGDIQKFLAANAIDKVKAAVYGFYGRTPDKKGPRGHAVALCGGAKPLFFDPNSGEWIFATGDDAGQEISSYISSRYTGWTRDFHFVMPLG